MELVLAAALALPPVASVPDDPGSLLRSDGFERRLERLPDNCGIHRPYDQRKQPTARPFWRGKAMPADGSSRLLVVRAFKEVAARR